MAAVVGVFYARVYDVTAAAAVAGSQISTASAIKEIVTSSAITMTDGHVYEIQFGVAAGDSGAPSKAALEVTD